MKSKKICYQMEKEEEETTKSCFARLHLNTDISTKDLTLTKMTVILKTVGTK